MKTILVWLLIATSNSHNNYGTATTIERFANVEDCKATAKLLDKYTTHRITRFTCVPARIVIIGGAS